MTRVAGISGGLAPARRGAPAGGFGLRPGTTDSAAPPTATAVAPAALLALQEAGPARPDPGRARRRAAAALDELRGLQLDLLAGRSDPARLARLAALAAEAGPETDPALAALLKDVSLRARLEIARRRGASESPA